MGIVVTENIAAGYKNVGSGFGKTLPCLGIYAAVNFDKGVGADTVDEVAQLGHFTT